MLSGDFWDRRFCRISTIPANALSGALIGAVKLHSRLYLLASITLSKTGTFFPSVTLSVIIHCSSLTIGGPGLRWAIKQVAFPPTASHFNAFQNTHVCTLNARTHAQPLHCSVGCGRSLARDWGSAFRASSWSLDAWPNICNVRTTQAGAARSLCPTQELSGAPTSALAWEDGDRAPVPSLHQSWTLCWCVCVKQRCRRRPYNSPFWARCVCAAATAEFEWLPGWTWWSWRGFRVFLPCPHTLQGARRVVRPLRAIGLSR